MTQTPRVIGSNALHRRILTLDRSDEEFSIQIAEALEILKIEPCALSVQHASDSSESVSQKSISPKDEWFLRWLLKRLNADDIHDRCPCLDLKAWQLLRILIARLTTTVSARLLSTFSFTAIVDRTLQWLATHVRGLPVSHGNGISCPSPEESEDSASSATLETSSPLYHKGSVKRKHGEAQHCNNGSFVITSMQAAELYLSVCGVVQQTILHTTFEKNIDHFNAEHMKTAIKSPPERAGKILGNAFAIAAHSWKLFQHENRFQTLNFHDFSTTPYIALWDMRYLNGDDSSDLSSIRAFSNQSLVPALQLVVFARRLLGEAHQSAVNRIEMLISRYVILPIRASILQPEKSKDFLNDMKKVKDQHIGEILLRPLTQELAAEIKVNSQNMATSIILESVSHVFDLTLRLFPTHNPKQRLTEFPWLQSLFHQLMHCLSLSSPAPKSTAPHPASIAALKRILYLGISSKIQLEQSLLERIISDLSGLDNGDELGPVDWELVHLCMKIDKNALLSTHSSTKDGNARSKIQSSDLLERLLRRVNAISLNELKLNIPASSSKMHQAVLYDFIVPLAKAFAEVRDLSRFLALWQNQLSAWYNDSGSSTSKALNGYTRSVWEDDELLKIIATELEESLTAGQILNIIETSYRIVAFSSAASPVIGESRIYACTTILDCVINAVHSENTLAILEMLYVPLIDAVASRIDAIGDQIKSYAWRLWRIVVAILEYWPHLEHASKLETQQARITSVAKRLVSLPMTSDGQMLHRPEVCGAQIYALRAAIYVSSRTTLVESVKKSTERTVSIIQMIIQGMIDTADNPLKHGIARNMENSLATEWDGRLEAISSKDVLLLAYVTELTFSIEKLMYLGKNLTNDFIENLYWCAFWGASRPHEAITTDPKSFGYTWLWDKLLQASGIIREEPRLREILYSVQLKNMDIISKTPTYLTATVRRNFVLSSLSQIPIQYFKRPDRERLANFVQARLLSSQDLGYYSDSHCQVVLLTRIAEFPNKSIALFNDPTFLWSVADNLSASELSPISYLAALSSAFKSLVKTTFVSLITITERSHQYEFLITFFKLLYDRVMISQWKSIRCAASNLSRISLHKFWTLEDQHLGRMHISRSVVNELRKKDFQWLLNCVSDPSFDQADYDGICELFESMLFYQDLLMALPTTGLAWNILRRCANEAVLRQTPPLSAQAATPTEDVSKARLEDGLVLAKKLILLRPGGLQSMRAVIESTSTVSLPTQGSREIILKQLEVSFIGLDQATQAEALFLVLERTNDVSTEEDSLLQLRSILNCQCEPDELISAMKTTLTKTFSALCDRLPRSETPNICILRMQCLDILLRKKPWAVLQWHVDSLVAAISTMTSSIGPSLPNQSAGNTFTGICRLFGSLLALHRAKLGGRFHMVVSALQGMLRCLFKPHTANLGCDSLILPPWLRDNDVVLNESHAAAYSRILTTICDPSVSAVTRQRNRMRQELNDETKRARRIAGHHLQYLIIEFCQCQLQGTLASEVRASLSPGLYAVFDAMGQDVLKTVNAALDTQSRPIFKATYDDYRRFGRWQDS